MKKIPKLRFPEFSGEWEEKRLKNILIKNQLGGNYENTLEETKSPLIKMGNLDRGLISLKKIEYIPESLEISENDRLKYGDLLFNTRNTLDLVGKVAIWRNELPIAFFNSNIMRLVFFDCDNFFMNNLFNTRKNIEKLRAIATGTTSVAAIYTRDLIEVSCSIPSLPEQEEIASFLSSVDSKIEKLERKKELWEQYKKGMMQKIFSQELRFRDENGEEYSEWEEKSLGEVCEIIMGQSPSSLAYNENLEGLPLIQGNADCKNRKIIPRVYTSEITKTSENGDIIMSVRAPAGTVAISNIRSCIGRGVCAIRKKIANQEYIFQYLISYEKEWSKYSQGSTFDSINSNDVKELTIPFPSLPEQTLIADFLSSIDSKIEIVEKELFGMKEFKKGLLQKMFV